MKNIDINGLVESVFNGALFGIAIGAGSGKTLAWAIVGTLLGIGATVADFLRAEKRKRNQNKEQE